tara:strand:+ start:280 stop:1167 length:888 start_codon:yes stop_codon:yes gene_type:complete
MIHGPTASGKTKLAIEWAKSLRCEILNCDARQIYKELKIGVARPSNQELQKINHIGIASHSIHDPVSAVSYSKWAIPLIRTSLIKNGNIVIVGGSGLYAKAILYELDVLPNENMELREKLQKQWDEEPNQLVEYLKEMDPEYANECDIKNSRRVIRAIEVIKTSGKKFSDLRTQKFLISNFDANIYEYAICPDFQELETRILLRTKNMFDSGLQREAMELEKYRELRALQTVGYKEFYTNPKASRKELILLIALRTRQYAKKQITWLKKDKNIIKMSPKNIAKLELSNFNLSKSK